MKLIKSPRIHSALGSVYEVTISPRCYHYRTFFRHTEPITFFTIRGVLLFDIDYEAHVVEKGRFIDVLAGMPYRFRSFEGLPTTIYAYAQSREVEQSWQEVGVALQEFAQTGRDGMTRFT